MDGMDYRLYSLKLLTIIVIVSYMLCQLYKLYIQYCLGNKVVRIREYTNYIPPPGSKDCP